MTDFLLLILNEGYNGNTETKKWEKETSNINMNYAKNVH